MPENASAPRSRRALLAAAAGGAAALAASAALPLAAVATDPNDVALGINNVPNPMGTTSVDTTIAADVTAFVGKAFGTGFGLHGSSTGGAGVYGWSVSGPVGLDPANLAYTGVFGFAPAAGTDTQVGVGVVGESDDWGVLGIGSVGVYGFGTYGVVGESDSTTAGVTAFASTPTNLALDVVGKVRFSRSGRTSIAAGQSTKVVTLAGTSSSSRVFALIHSNRSGRWVRAVVPTSGSFKIYLNGTVSSSTYVAWFVLN